MGKFSSTLIKLFCGVDLNSINSELANLKQENNRVSELLKNTSNEYNELNERYKKVNANISEYESKYKSCTDELAECKLNLESLIKENNSLKESFSNNENKLKSIQEEYNSYTSKYSEKKLELEASSKEVALLKENIRKNEEELSEKAHLLKKSDNEISLLKDEIRKKNDEIVSLKDEIKKIIDYKTVLENNLKETEIKLKGNSSSFEELMNSSKELELLVSEKDKQLSVLESQIAEKLLEIEKTSSEVNSLNEKYIKATDEIDSLKMELNNVSLEKTELEKALIESNNKLKELDNIIEELKSQPKSPVESIIEESEIENSENEKEEYITEDSENSEEKAQEVESAPFDEEKEKEKLNSDIVALTRKYDYVRVTTNIGNQYIYQSKHLQMKAGLFDWGIEGYEIITDEILFLTHDKVSRLEGLDTPFDSEELVCDLSNEESAQQLVESLLMAICTYQPVQINYHDKNGRTTVKNLYYLSFQPLVGKFTLPYDNMFKDMLEENLDTDHVSAICPHNPEPRNFSISQIATIRRYNAYFTTEDGIKIMREGIALAEKAEQQEMVDILSSRLPQ